MSPSLTPRGIAGAGLTQSAFLRPVHLDRIGRACECEWAWREATALSTCWTDAPSSGRAVDGVSASE